MIEFNNTQIETDKQGYLLDHTQWCESLAPIIAAEENIELSEAHWEVVRFVRDFYEEYNTSPAIRMLVKAMAKALGEDKGNSIYLMTLFPESPPKQAAKIAGLPRPANCF